MRRPPVWRLVAMLLAFMLAMGGILVRLAVLQVGQAHAFQGLAASQHLRTVELPALRGRILDRDGEELALSLSARDVYADPRHVREPITTAGRLAPLLGLEVGDVLENLTAEDTSFVYIARQVETPAAERVAELGLAGIGFLPTSRRYYPAGSLAAQVLGFVGQDGVGLDGLEFAYQDVLTGVPGERSEEVGASGQPIASGVSETRAPEAGRDVMMTIDRYLQHRAQAALAGAVQANRAKGGTVIVMDSRNGDILAMASYPTFDPNRIDIAEEDAWRNRAVTDSFEPGSVNKVITASAAVEEHVIPLREVLTVPGAIRLGGSTFNDSHPHPPERMTLGDIIAKSSNVGTITVARRLGSERLAEYLARFGFGQHTGLGFPGESAGQLRPLYGWHPTDMGTIPIGQGVAVTPLQMASVYATIANGGVRVQPRLVRGMVDAQGELHEAASSPRRRVVSRRTAEIVTRMLAYAVAEGTGQAARVPDYQVAGKTGTARKPYEDRAGYSRQHMASFIGFLPASRPRVVIAAILDEPATVYGGTAAAPLFQEIARYSIMRLGIAPGDPVRLPPRAADL